MRVNFNPRHFRLLQLLFSSCAKLKDFARAYVTRVTSYAEGRSLAPDRTQLSGGSKGRGHMGHGPPLEARGPKDLPGAPPAYQGYHSPDRGTTGPPGAPQA